MKIKEIIPISEKKINDSSWIVEIVYRNGNTVLRFNTSKKIYTVHSVPRTVHLAWLKSPSKGDFYHENIKGKYVVTS